MSRACRSIAPALLLLLSLGFSMAQAQTAYLVRDIQPGERRELAPPPSTFQGLGPFAVLGNKTLFTAGGGVWVSDGTSAGTEPLAEVCPGGCQPKVLGTHRGIVYWVATLYSDTHVNPWQLWRSDGTRAGTFPLTDLNEVRLPSEDYRSFAFGNRFLFFTACLPEAGCGLWRTDGTLAGTLHISSIPATPVPDFRSLAAQGDRVFVSVYRDQQTELWVTDGTDRGTSLIRRFPSPAYLAGKLTAAGNRLFFTANEGQGEELWSTDGTPAGTRALTQFPNDFPFGLEGWHLKVSGNRVYFVANDVVHGYEAWRSDGTVAGTTRITDFGYHAPFGEHLYSNNFEEVGNRLIFTADDGISGRQVWVNTGTPASTQPLLEGCSTAGTCNFPVRSELYRAGNRILFLGHDSQHGTELWSTDGTVAGTRLVRDLCPGSCDSTLDLQAFAGGVAFAARESTQLYQRNNLWISDGTLNGTRRLFAGDAEAVVPERPHVGVTADGKTFFSVWTSRGDILWVSDGTSRGARVVDRLSSGASGSTLRNLEVLGDRLFFADCTDGPAGSQEIWQTTGTAESTTEVTDHGGVCRSDSGSLYSAAAGNLVLYAFDNSLWKLDGTAAGAQRFLTLLPTQVVVKIVPLGTQFYLLVSDRFNYRAEIWRSDGTAQGTGRVLDLPDIKSVNQLFSTGRELFFYGGDQQDFQALWISDGTAAGTRKLLSGELDFFSGRPELVRVGPLVYFSGRDTDEQTEIWVTDGFPSGTRRVAALPGAYSDAWDLTAHQGLLYFFFESYSDGEPELWRSDGTTAGTSVVRRFRLRDDFEEETFLTSFAGSLYFAADGGDGGFEIWKSDGTAAGTAILRDIAPGDADSGAAGLTVVDGRLFFTANDILHGVELWQSDGTAAGTRLVQDVAPGALSSSPEQLTAARDRLYFTADDGVAGRELWALPLSGAAGCQPSSTRLCLGGGRFQAEIAWRDFQGNTGAGRAVPLTGDTGYFWFFDPANVETVVKVLDGQGLNGHHWVFYGALSSVEYTLTVTDTRTNLTRRYFNPSGNFASVGDTQSFGRLGAFSTAPSPQTTAPVAAALVEERFDAAAATGSCQAGPLRLCLGNGRFAVEIAWKDFQGRTGAGQAVPLTGDTGYFWFFDAANVEVVTKVLDGTGLNGKHWFFYGALSSVEYRITVTDTATGKVKTYVNPSGRFASVGDTGAF